MAPDDPPTLQYHHPDAPLFSVAYITDDQRQYKQKEIKLRKQDDTALLTERDAVGGEERYLLYTKRARDAVMPDFATEADVRTWLDDHFDDDDIPVLLAVVDIFAGILQEKEEQGTPIEFYKQLQLEKLPEVLARVEWGQPVPDVGAELLSAFVIAHPMPKANHRTGIGLLERYLTSNDEAFTLPAPAPEAEPTWFSAAAEYIYSSKRLLVLRRTTPILRWAHKYGYRRVERKEGIHLDLQDVDFDRRDHFERYTERHRARSKTFVETLVDDAGATQLHHATDDGKRAFVERFRAAQ